MSTPNSEWFARWFDSPYYHQLYKNRDEAEAHKFLDVLIAKLNIWKGASILDLGCGRGRYAKYLSSKHFDVMGIDLSPNNIANAKQFERDNLQFKVHDMRLPVEGYKFDYVFNLFTSFGYFRTDEEDKAVLQAVKQEIQDNGTLIIDYMNCKKAIRELKGEEVVEVDGIRFDIKRWVADRRIHKQIEVDGEKFKEEVEVLGLNQFQEYAGMTGFTLSEVFGNYQLQAFDPEKSDRLIMFLIPTENDI